MMCVNRREAKGWTKPNSLAMEVACPRTPHASCLTKITRSDSPLSRYLFRDCAPRGDRRPITNPPGLTSRRIILATLAAAMPVPDASPTAPIGSCGRQRADQNQLHRHRRGQRRHTTRTQLPCTVYVQITGWSGTRRKRGPNPACDAVSGDRFSLRFYAKRISDIVWLGVLFTKRSIFGVMKRLGGKFGWQRSTMLSNSKREQPEVFVYGC